MSNTQSWFHTGGKRHIIMIGGISLVVGKSYAGVQMSYEDLSNVIAEISRKVSESE